MRFDRIAFYCAGLAAATVWGAAAHADNSPLGVWIDHTGRGAVEISDCSGKLCGRVAWVKDAENSKECGKQIIGNVAPVGKNKWDNGWIYDPDRGSKYDVELTLLDNDQLRVKGYAGTKWLSETYTWKRAAADLQKCTLSTAADAAKPAAEEKSGSVQLNAAKPDSDTAKTDAGKSDVSKPDPSATASATPGDETGDEPQGGKTDGKKVVARIMDELENGDGPVKLKRTGKTCKVTAPYVGVISFPCDGDKD